MFLAVPVLSWLKGAPGPGTVSLLFHMVIPHYMETPLPHRLLGSVHTYSLSDPLPRHVKTSPLGTP